MPSVEVLGRLAELRETQLEDPSGALDAWLERSLGQLNQELRDALHVREAEGLCLRVWLHDLGGRIHVAIHECDLRVVCCQCSVLLLLAEVRHPTRNSWVSAARN